MIEFKKAEKFTIFYNTLNIKLLYKLDTPSLIFLVVFVYSYNYIIIFITIQAIIITIILNNQENRTTKAIQLYQF